MATHDDAPFDALAARVDAAAARLPERERTVLALRESQGAGYAEIAAALGVDQAQIPDLLVTARLAVREQVRHAPSPPLATPDCPEARRLLVARQDGERVDPVSATWVREHVEGCDACRAVRRALREASLACRSWDPGALVLVPAPAPVAEPEPVVAPDPEPVVAPEPVLDPLPAASEAPPGPRPGAQRLRGEPPAGTARRRRRGARALAAGLVTAGVVAVAAMVIGGPSTDPGGKAKPHATPESVSQSRSGGRAAELRRARRAAARRKARAARQRAAAAQPGAAPTPSATAATATATAPTAPAATATPKPAPARAPVKTAVPTAPPGGDIVPPPGDQFCPVGEPNCK